MADNFGLRIGLEGEKEFKKALADINFSFKVLGSEMKLISSEFDKNDKSVEALAARNTVLNKEIEAQKQKIETLRAALDNAASSFGENDRRTQAWQIQLNNAEAALNDMECELKENNSELDNAEKIFDEAGVEAEIHSLISGSLCGMRIRFCTLIFNPAGIWHIPYRNEMCSVLASFSSEAKPAERSWNEQEVHHKKRLRKGIRRGCHKGAGRSHPGRISRDRIPHAIRRTYPCSQVRKGQLSVAVRVPVSEQMTVVGFVAPAMGKIYRCGQNRIRV